jgi:hypothetical protein
MAVETDTLGQAPAPDGLSSEWHPTRTTWIHGEIPQSATGTVDMPVLIGVVLLGLGIAWVHEGVHGIFMLAFGGRPQFGILRTGILVYAFYATSPGQRFTRRQFLAVALAPLAILGLLGIPLCMLTPYLVVPFALHLAGCMGDIGISWHVLQRPPTVMCEDLRDGVRFWKQAA